MANEVVDIIMTFSRTNAHTHTHTPARYYYILLLLRQLSSPFAAAAVNGA